MRSRLERYQSRMTTALTASVTPVCSRRVIGSGTSTARRDRRRMRYLQCTAAVSMIPLASARAGACAWNAPARRAALPLPPTNAPISLASACATRQVIVKK